MSERQPKTTTEQPAGKGLIWCVAALVVLATLALFWSATRFEFLNLDDDLYVHGNPHVRGGLTAQGLAYALTTTDGGSWMPLTWLSYLLDAQLWGAEAAGFHATNVVLHALAAGLLFLAMHRMTREPWPSALAALLFALHPLRLESVAWIAERKDVLSGVFCMLTLLAYARYVAQPSKARMFVTFGCFVLGLVAKPMLVTLPFVLLLLDVWPLRRISLDWATIRNRAAALVKEKSLLFAATVVFAVITLRSQSAAGAVVSTTTAGEWRLLRIVDNLGFYLGKLFWPAQLNVLYPIGTPAAERTVLWLSLLAVLTFFAVRFARQRAWLAVGWFWFLGMLIPVIGVVPIGSTWVADRYTYIPSVGIAIALAWALWTSIGRAGFKLGYALVTLVILIVLAAATVRDLPRWQNSVALFSDSVRKGDHPGAYQNLGVALADRGEFETAVAHFTRALELNPQSAEACYNRANTFRALEQFDRAEADYTRAIELKSDYAEAFNNRGSLRAARGRIAEAIQDFTQAISLRSDYVEALGNRGHAFLEAGKFHEAVDDYSKAIASKPNYAGAYHDRAVAYFALKDYARAWADINACRKLGATPSSELLRRLEADSGRRE